MIKTEDINRVVLIGNGFDLAHGLKTSYNDFINDFWISEKEKAVKGLSIKGYSNTFTYSDDFIKINSPCPFDNLPTSININDNGYKWFKTLSKANLSSRVNNFEITLRVELNSFFETISDKNQIQNWVDVEEEYYVALKKCYEERRLDSIKDLNKDFSKVLDALKIYLMKETLKDIKPDKTIEQNIYSDPFQQLGKTPNHLRDILFLNFNYTKTEELYMKSSKYPFLSVHIHGELDNSDNPIIFGYGDELDEKYKLIEQLNDNRYLENIKSIKYLETRNYMELLSFIDSARYEVFIMGHSCGISDRTLLNTLFEHENCVSIKFFYYKENDDKNNYSDIVRNISRNFTNKPLMRKIVVNKKDSVPLN